MNTAQYWQLLNLDTGTVLESVVHFGLWERQAPTVQHQYPYRLQWFCSDDGVRFESVGPVFGRHSSSHHQGSATFLSPESYRILRELSQSRHESDENDGPHA